MTRQPTRHILEKTKSFRRLTDRFDYEGANAKVKMFRDWQITEQNNSALPSKPLVLLWKSIFHAWQIHGGSSETSV